MSNFRWRRGVASLQRPRVTHLLGFNSLDVLWGNATEFIVKTRDVHGLFCGHAPPQSTSSAFFWLLASVTDAIVTAAFA